MASTIRLSTYLALAGVLFFSELAPMAQCQESEKPTAAHIDKLRKQLASDDFRERTVAANELAEIGPAAKAAIPDLFRAMFDPSDLHPGTNLFGDSVTAAEIALSKIGPPTMIADCFRFLGNEFGVSDQARICLGSLMTQLYRPGDPVVDRIICDALEDKSALVRAAAVGIITQRNAPIKGALPIFLGRLQKNRGEDLNLATMGLRGFGPQAVDALPRLMEIHRTSEPDSAIQFNSLAAIGIVGRESEKVADFLREILNDETKNASLRAMAARSLGDSKHGRGAIPDLFKVIFQIQPLRPDESSPKRWLMTGALGAVSRLSPDKTTVTPLVKILVGAESTDSDFKAMVLRALGKVGSDARSSLPTVFADFEGAIDTSSVSIAYARFFIAVLGTDAEPELRTHAKGHVDAELVERYDRLIRTVKELRARARTAK